MPSDIRFLNDLREDLMEAAWGETLGRKHGRPRRPRVPGRVLALAALVTAFLMVAGGIGFLATGGLGVMSGDEAAMSRDAPAGEPRPAADDARGDAFGPAEPERNLFTDDEASLDSAGEAGIPSAQGGEGEEDGDPIGGSTGVRTPSDLSKIVKTADLAVVVPNGEFDEAFRDAVDVASRFGGYVETSSTRGGRQGSVRIRVPAGRFDAAVAALVELGRVTRHEIKGQDVTGKFVDYRARLDILRVRRGVIRELMEDADTIDQRLRLQREFDQVQLQIEEIQGALNVLKNQVTKATISLSLREKDAPVPQRPDVDRPSLLGAWDRSIAGFLGVVYAVVVGLGYLVPIAVLLGGGWLVARLVRRRTE